MIDKKLFGASNTNTGVAVGGFGMGHVLWYPYYTQTWVTDIYAHLTALKLFVLFYFFLHRMTWDYS